ncbi:acyl carrier protein [Streptomyces kanamyceticus]|uniref:Acyl carrier protein n=1 Tax=Streptomyces kanamyceticus TaxID=1967 RepID=A0A5J6G8C1_STRKN|nr:acyl carrier protein [Streptomyces kanamyceticus]QEU90188.1 acyl carrier protein [Streptomyces kanamyceticus]
MNTESAVHGNELAIAAMLQDAIATDLELAPGQRLDWHTSFVELGLDSAAVVAVSGAAGQRLGLEVPPEWLFDHPTIHGLAQFLARKTSPEEDRV